MKLAVFYGHLREAAAQQHVSVEEMLDYAKSLGIDYVEIIRDDDILKAGRTAEELKAELDRHGMKVSNVCGYFAFATDPDDYRDFGQIRDTITLGCTSMMPIPGLHTGDEEKKAQELKQMVEGMAVVVRKAEEAGVTSVIEPYDNQASPVMSSAGMRYFVERCPGLYYNIDTGNLNYNCEDIDEVYGWMKEKIRHVHLKDRSEVSDGTMPGHRTDGSPIWPCAVGDGVVPVARFLREMEASGYDGVYTIEHFGMKDQKEAIARSVRNIREMLEA